MKTLLLCVAGICMLGSDLLTAQTPEADKLDKMADESFAKRDFKAALASMRKLLEIRERRLGREHPLVAEALARMAGLHDQLGDTSAQLPLLERALSILEKTRPLDAASVADLTAILGRIYAKQGEFRKAEPHYRRTLELREKADGEEAESTGLALNNLGFFLLSAGRSAEAEPVLRRALPISERTYGREHPETATVLDNLAFAYDEEGRSPEAEPLVQRALAIREKTLPANDPKIAHSLSTLAGIRYNQKDFGAAEALLLRALTIQETSPDGQQDHTAFLLDSLGRLYADMGDFPRAESHYARALKIRRKLKHPYAASTLHHLAYLRMRSGSWNDAVPLLEEALAIIEKSNGPRTSKLIEPLSLLGVVQAKGGAFDKGESTLQRALNLCELELGPRDPLTATTLSNAALIAMVRGNDQHAEKLGRRALAIFEETLGHDNATTADCRKNLAAVCYNQDAIAEARRLSIETEESQRVILRNVLSFTSEEQRLAFQARHNPYFLPVMLGDTEAMARAALRYKGVVLDSVLEDRQLAARSLKQEQRDQFERWTTLKQQIGQRLLQPKIGNTDPNLEDLRSQAERMERQLAREVGGIGQARRALEVTVEEVRAVIPNHAAVIEFARHDRYRGKGDGDKGYSAIILTREGPIRLVPLPGTAEDLEHDVALYRKSVSNQTDETTLTQVLRRLSQTVWQPISAALGKDVNRLIISPDGGLNYLSFATLLESDDRFLGERMEIHYVASSRDLIRQVSPATGQEVVIFADPAFLNVKTKTRPNVASQARLSSQQTAPMDERWLTELPGTRAESQLLAAEARRHGRKVEEFLGPQATEAELRRIRSPGILHLATHGFVLESRGSVPKTNAEFVPDSTGESSRSAQSSPQGVLAFSSARNSLQAWQSGRQIGPADDGLLTSEEASTLDLSGTWLVTLSACETGAGEVRIGEGVLGLRRAFAQTGARHLLMTLWAVHDESTAPFMADFYRHALASNAATRALAETQRDWLRKGRLENGVLYAVRHAGAFLMNEVGAP